MGFPLLCLAGPEERLAMAPPCRIQSQQSSRRDLPGGCSCSKGTVALPDHTGAPAALDTIR